MQLRFLNTDIDLDRGVLPERASAVVFDCDGLLADTEQLWLRVVRECADRHGIQAQDTDAFRGVSIMEAAADLSARSARELGGEISEHDLGRALMQDFTALVSHEATAMPGAVALIRELIRVVPVSIASNSPRVLLDRILRRIGLGDLIESSVACDEVDAAKPAPDLYLAALDNMRAHDAAITAETAVAFEDSPVGSRAAISAGLLVVGVNADPNITLSCHDRYASLTDEALTKWAQNLRQHRHTAPSPMAQLVGQHDAVANTLALRCQYPQGQEASVAIYRQEQCRWNELPSQEPVAVHDINPGAAELRVDLRGYPKDTYRYFLLTDGALPEWNGRTGEFSIGNTSSTNWTVPKPRPTSGRGVVDVMTWNLWFGGCHFNHGTAKQARYLQKFPHQIVALQECFEVQGRQLAETIGWNIAQQGPDTAILSPYPVHLHETSTTPYATCATVELPEHSVTVWSVHLWHSDYGPYTGINPEIPPELTLASRGERLRTAQLATVLAEQKRLERTGVVPADTPVFIAGDFNVPSHVDWEDGRRGNAIEWPTSKMLDIAGFVDTYRAVHPLVHTAPGHTWSPIIAEDVEPRDRIDFVYARAAEVLDAYTVAGNPDTTPEFKAVRPTERATHFMGAHLDDDWPTDHAAVVAVVSLAKTQAQ